MALRPAALRTTTLAIFLLVALLVFSILLVLSTRSSGNLNDNQNQTDNCVPTPGQPCLPTAPAPSFFTNFGPWSGSQYFTGAYLPTLLAVLLNAFWDIIFTRLKEMEPFLQLAQPGGAPAKESLLLRYSSTDTVPLVQQSPHLHYYGLLGIVGPDDRCVALLGSAIHRQNRCLHKYQRS